MMMKGGKLACHDGGSGRYEQPILESMLRMRKAPWKCGEPGAGQLHRPQRASVSMSPAGFD